MVVTGKLASAGRFIVSKTVRQQGIKDGKRLRADAETWVNFQTHLSASKHELCDAESN